MLTYKDLPFINKVKNNQQEFGEKVISISDELNISPNWLMIVINNESAGTFSPSIKNPTSTATGLIQFMEATAKSLGTSTSQLASMTNVQQLDYVKKYLSRYASKIKSAADMYLAVFFPKALWQSDSYVFPQWATKANPIFDINKDKILTKAEFNQYVQKKYAPYLKNEFEYLYGEKKNGQQ